MASINWPASLPAPIQDGYGESPPNTTIVTQMDAGPAKVRRRYTAAPRKLTLTYHLTAAQIADFDAFYVSTSKSGSLAFNWTHPRTGASVEARFAPGTAPNYAAVDHEGEVSCQIEVLP